MKEITIHSIHGQRQVEPLHVEGGLAITPFLYATCNFSDDEFTITHVPTGRKLTGRLSKRTAKVALAKLLPLVDWTTITTKTAQRRGKRLRVAVTKAIDEALNESH